MTLPRTRRLQADFEELKTVFSNNAHINFKINPAILPPEEYVFSFAIPALIVTSAGWVEQVDLTSVALTLPSRYPSERPMAIPLDPIYHPNFGKTICVFDAWTPASHLSDFILTIGKMIQWEIVDQKNAYNAFAARDYASRSILHPLQGYVNLGATLNTKRNEL